MEDQRNFRTNYNYLFNSYDRSNLSDTVDPPSGNNVSMSLADYQQYSRNPVLSSSVNVVRSQLEMGKQQSNYLNANNPVHFCNQSNSHLEQSKRINRLNVKHTAGNITNFFMPQQSTVSSNCSMQDTEKSLEYNRSADKLSNICNILKDDDTPAGTLECYTMSNFVKVEQDYDLEDTDSNRKDQNLVSVDEMKRSDTDCKNDIVLTIKEETFIDEKSTDIECHEENKDDKGELSDASTIIEDEVTDKLMKRKSKLPSRLKDKSKRNSRKTPQEQEMPKIGLQKSTKEYKCETCAKVVQSQRALIKHRNLHTENFKCKECNKIFNSAESLKNHNKVHAGFIGNEVCNVCDKTFYDKSSLKKHTLSVHMGITNFQCEYCHLSFFARKTYEEHVRVHTGEKPFKCTLCPRAYKRVADLNHHVRLHKGEVSHTCDKCGEGFRRKSELNRHMNTKHSDDPSKTVNSITKEKKCQLCGLAFSTSKALNAHLSDHNLFEGIVHKEVTKQGQPDNSVGNNISTNGPNITNKMTSLFVPGVSINQGSQGFLEGEMSMSHVLDMTYKNMRQTGPDKLQKSIQEWKDLDEGIIEKDTSKTNKFKTSVISAQNTLDRVAEHSNSPIENEEEDIINDEIYTSNAGIDFIAADEGINVGDILHIKPEIQDDCIHNGIEIVTDDYDADTDVEDYNYVFSATDNTNSDIIQKKITTTMAETIVSDFQGSKKTEENHKENPDFEPKVDKVSRRKATKPRKKVQKKEVIKKEVEDQDSDDLNVENEEKTKKIKENIKQKAKNDDESLDLVSLKCLLCGKKFAKKITLKMHMNIHRGTYTCKICGKCFATNNSLKLHIDNHEGRKMKTAVCNVCDKVFYDASSVNKHVKTVHMDYRPYSCTECDQRFSETKTLNEHMRVHTGERPFACEVCGKTFKRTSELNFHIRKHNGEVNMNCTECGKGFIRMGQLRQHMMLKHDKERPFRCFICQKTFPTPVMLKDHRKMHVILKKHVCQKCGHRFHSKSKLGKHLRRKTDCQTDSGVNKDGKFVCQYCYQEFSKIEERYTHIQERHKNNEQRKHPCEVCGKQFRRSQALKIHLKIHYQVRDFKCTVCNAAFIQRHHLTQHIATHTGSRPYQCNVCMRSFAHSATLYNHMKHH